MKEKDRLKEAQKATWVGFFVNLILTIFKFIAGFLGNSSAMVADAVHSFSDIATDLAVLFGLRAASKPEDEDHSFGHGKFETIVATFIGLFLVGVSIGLILNSGKVLHDLYNGGEIPRPGWIAVVAAVVSILLKEWTYHYTVRKARQVNSKALEANAWHHRTDSLSSIAVLIGVGGAIILGGKWTILDPIAAVGVSILILWVSFKLLRSTLMELSEASLDPETEKRILKVINSVEGTRDPHNLRTRNIGASIAIDVHVKAPGNITLSEAHEISFRVEEALRKEFGKGTYINVHMDPCDV